MASVLRAARLLWALAAHVRGSCGGLGEGIPAPPTPSSFLPQEGKFACASSTARGKLQLKFTMASQRSEVFFAKICEYGLEDLVGAFKAKGITSFATFAFASNFNPQMADASILTTELLEPLSKTDASLIPKLRMLWWVAWGGGHLGHEEIIRGQGRRQTT